MERSGNFYTPWGGKFNFFIWINGIQVGYSEDSKTPAEFNVTKHVRVGSNSVAIGDYQYPISLAVHRCENLLCTLVKSEKQL